MFTLSSSSFFLFSESCMDVKWQLVSGTQSTIQCACYQGNIWAAWWPSTESLWRAGWTQWLATTSRKRMYGCGWTQSPQITGKFSQRLKVKFWFLLRFYTKDTPLCGGGGVCLLFCCCCFLFSIDQDLFCNIVFVMHLMNKLEDDCLYVNNQWNLALFSWNYYHLEIEGSCLNS